MTDMTLPPATDDAAGSGDVAAENLARLKALFPQIVRDGAIDVEVLRQLVGEAVETGEERYGLNWKGKAAARAHALTPSQGTLRPAKADSVDWDSTQNIMIEGDNLEVLKLLRRSYAGKVKLIYIDPPYNTGRDFVYPDNYRDTLRNYSQLVEYKDSSGSQLQSNSDASGRYHGSWLSMMLPRLMIAKELLRDDGAIFITIDDVEVGNIKCLCNEIFGEDNFVAQVEWQKRYTRSNNTDNFTSVIDHVLIYSKSGDFSVNLLPRDEEANARYSNPDSDPRGPWKATPFLNQVAPDRRANLCYPITNPITGEVTNPTTKAWRYESSVFERLLTENRLYWGKDGRRPVPDIKTYLSEVRDGMTPINFWSHEYASHTDEANREIKVIFGEKVFDTPKPVMLIRRMLEHAGSGDELVVDFFAGSGTTGQAVMQQNAESGGTRRFILVQLPEPLDPGKPEQKLAADFCEKIGRPRNIAELTKERLRRAGASLKTGLLGQNLDTGFRVYKLATSNLRPWQPAGDDLVGSLLDAVDNVLPGRGEDDLLVELMLKTGIDLAMPSETHTIAGQTVHSFGGGALMVCLGTIADAKAEELALGIAAWRAELAPAGQTAFWFKDSGFASAAAKANVAAILRQRIAASDIARIAAL